jgi:hypothetical protein
LIETEKKWEKKFNEPYLSEEKSLATSMIFIDLIFDLVNLFFKSIKIVP